MKTSFKIAATASAMLLLFALLIGGLLSIYTNQNWVYTEYEKLDIEADTDWDISTSTVVLREMLDYSIGRLDTLEDLRLRDGYFFNEREISHMKDVQKLTMTVMILGLAALIIGLGLFALVFLKNGWTADETFSRAFLIALGVLILIVAALGIWIAVDFDSFWSAFHVVFLDLESSTFDPAESNMIRICPAELFSDIIKNYAMQTGLIALLPVAVCIFTLCLKKKRELDAAERLALLLFFLAAAMQIATLLTDSVWFAVLAAALMITSIVLHIKRKRNGRVY